MKRCLHVVLGTVVVAALVTGCKAKVEPQSTPSDEPQIEIPEESATPSTPLPPASPPLLCHRPSRLRLNRLPRAQPANQQHPPKSPLQTRRHKPR